MTHRLTPMEASILVAVRAKPGLTMKELPADIKINLSSMFQREAHNIERGE